MSWRMNVSVLLVLAGCTEARDSLIAEDRAAVAAYERYQAKIAPGSNLRIDVEVTEPARRMQPGEVAGLLRRLPRSRYLIPYFASASMYPARGIITTLHPRLEQWGQNGYPVSEALATTGPGPVASNELEETTGTLLDAGTGSGTGSDSGSGSGSGSDSCSANWRSRSTAGMPSADERKAEYEPTLQAFLRLLVRHGAAKTTPMQTKGSLSKVT